MVRDKYDSLIAVAANQEKESRGQMTSLEKNLDLLGNIKIHLDKEALTLGDVQNYQETVSGIIQHTNQTVFEPCTSLHMEYKNCKGKGRLVEELCGELIKKQYIPESGHSIDLTTDARLAIPGVGPQNQCHDEGSDPVPQSSSASEEEVAGALSATNLEETEEGNASTLEIDQVHPKFQRKLY